MSKKNRKRRSMIAVILLIAFLITGCEDKSVKTDHIIRIGVVTYTQDDPFINAMTDQLKENLKKMDTKVYNGEHVVPIRLYFPTENAMSAGIEEGSTFPVLLFFHGRRL